MSTTLRADARRNRNALVEAAREVFARRGVMVALEEVAAAAGVGRGTLYRHFADRAALVTAVYADAVAGHRAALGEDPDAPDAVRMLLDRITRAQLDLAGLYPYLLTADAGSEGLASIAHDTRALFVDALPVSRAAGTVRPDVTVDDLMLVLYMVEGVISGHTRDDAERVRSRCLDMVAPSIFT